MNYRNLILTIMFCLAICGCSSTSENFVDSTGIVIAEILNNSRYIPNEVIGWTNIIVERIDTTNPTTAELTPTKRWDFGPKLKYAGKMAPGIYRISKLHYFKRTDSYIATHDALAPFHLGTFEVAKGKVTNLGTLIYHPLFTPHFLDDSETGDHLITRQENIELPERVALDLPNWRQLFMTSPHLTWLAEGNSEKREHTLQIIKNAALPTRIFKADEYFLLATKTGGVYQQKKLRWFYHDLAIRERINNIVQTSTNEFLVQLGASRLVSFDSGFKQQQLIRHFKTQTIHAVLKHQQSIYIATITNKQDLILYEWKKESGLLQLCSVSINQLPGDVRFRAAKVFAVNDLISIHVGQNRIEFNPQTLDWKIQPIPIEVHIFVETDTYITGAQSTTWSGIGDTQISTDKGESWQVTSVKENQIFMDTSGALYHIDKGFSLNLRLGSNIMQKVPFYQSKDMGKTWQQIGSLPRQCNQFKSEHANDNDFIVLCDNGNLMQSTDKGKTWTLLFIRPEAILD